MICSASSRRKWSGNSRNPLLIVSYSRAYGQAPLPHFGSNRQGEWRRILLILLNSALKIGRSLKPKMLNMLDGLFLYDLIVLSYLVSQCWKVKGEDDRDTVEEL